MTSEEDLDLTPSVSAVAGFTEQRLRLSTWTDLDWNIDTAFLKDIKSKAARFCMNAKESRLFLNIRSIPMSITVSKGTDVPKTEFDQWEFGSFINTMYPLVKDTQPYMMIIGSSPTQEWWYPRGIVFMVDGKISEFENMSKCVYTPTYEVKTTIKFGPQKKKYNDVLLHYWSFEATQWIGTEKSIVWEGMVSFLDCLDFLTGALRYDEDQVKFYDYSGGKNDEKEDPWTNGDYKGISKNHPAETKQAVNGLLRPVMTILSGMFVEFQPKCVQQVHLLMTGRQYMHVRPLKVKDIVTVEDPGKGGVTLFNQIEMRAIDYKQARICPEFQD